MYDVYDIYYQEGIKNAPYSAANEVKLEPPGILGFIVEKLSEVFAYLFKLAWKFCDDVEKFVKNIRAKFGRKSKRQNKEEPDPNQGKSSAEIYAESLANQPDPATDVLVGLQTDLQELNRDIQTMCIGYEKYCTTEEQFVSIDNSSSNNRLRYLSDVKKFNSSVSHVVIKIKEKKIAVANMSLDWVEGMADMYSNMTHKIIECTKLLQERVQSFVDLDTRVTNGVNGILNNLINILTELKAGEAGVETLTHLIVS